VSTILGIGFDDLEHGNENTVPKFYRKITCPDTSKDEQNQVSGTSVFSEKIPTFYVRRFSPLFRAKHCFSGLEEKHNTHPQR
jgi:hypothetical protein